MSTAAPLALTGASVAFGKRRLWGPLDLTVGAGEFLTVLGPNGSGKTTLLRVALGLQPLTTGTITVLGRPVTRGSAAIGYVPQQRRIDPVTPVRARDLVKMGIDGGRWGIGGRQLRGRVDELLAAVGATDYADAPVGLLSGGEQQRIRIAQALATAPAVLLCDEPLLSLDLRHQGEITDLIATTCKNLGTAVLFVTHEINPVLPVTDRVLYLAPFGHATGTPDEVLSSDRLSHLYDADIEVLRVGGRIIIVGGEHHEHHVEDEEQDA